MTKWLLPVEAGLVMPDPAPEVVSPPYDLFTPDQRSQHGADHPRSFLNGTPSEGDDPDLDYKRRRTKAVSYLEAEMSRSTWQFRPACLYLLRIDSGAHSQTGVVGDVPADLFPGIVRPHEHTRPDRVDDLADYLTTVGYGSSPVGVTYRRRPEIDAIADLISDGRPQLDVVLPDGDRQRVWVIGDREVMLGLEAAFASVPSCYIIDGHHRVAATLQRGEDPATPAGRFLVVAFPDDDLVVYPFHRWVNGQMPFETGQLPVPLQVSPGRAIGVSRRGEWSIDLNPGPDEEDVSALARTVLGPRLGIEDERTDPRLTFVPGYPGPDALRQKVAAQGGVGFLLHPTSVEAVIAVSDRGGVMPPKATFFAPKPRSGVFLVKR